MSASSLSLPIFLRINFLISYLIVTDSQNTFDWHTQRALLNDKKAGAGCTSRAFKHPGRDVTAPDVWPSILTDYTYDSELDNADGVPLAFRRSSMFPEGNTILRCYVFNTHMQLSRATQFCERASGNINGRPVAITDKPGLNKMNRKEKEVIREIMKSVSLCKPVPLVFLLVQPMGNLTNEDKNMHKWIQNMFGKNIWNYTVVLFTHGDRLEGKVPNDVIASSDKDLTDSVNFEQVIKLLEKIDTMVAINGKSCYTTSFYPNSERKICEKQEKILKERQEEIARKERELEDNYDDDEELERNKRELWREEEEYAIQQEAKLWQQAIPEQDHRSFTNQIMLWAVQEMSYEWWRCNIPCRWR